MEFDKSKILTCVTADQAKVGQKGWFGETLSSLEKRVEKEHPEVLERVLLSGDRRYIFMANNDSWSLFYPAPEPYFNVGDWVEVTENLGLLNKGAVGRVIKMNDGFNKIWVDIKGTEWAITDRFLNAVPEPKHRPFNAEELCSLVGKVVTNRLTGYPNLVTGVTNSGKSVFVGTSCVSASVLMDKFTLNGEPCGMKEEA